MSDRPRLSIALHQSLTHQVQAALVAVLEEAGPELLSDRRVSELRHALHDGRSPNYDRDWAAFSYLYFAANFAKSHLAVRRLQWPPLEPPVRILDLGAGGGASVLGAVTALQATHPRNAPGVVRVVAVDSSRRQLEVFDRVTRPFLEERFPGVEVESCREDVIDFLRASAGDDNLVLASYLLAELGPDRSQTLRNELLRQYRGKHCTAAIIESDPLGRGITLETPPNPPELLSYDEVTLDLSFLDRLGLAEKPKFSGVSPFKALLLAYFEAWRTHDSDTIARIFAPDARYEINHRSTLQGREQILGYWKAIAAKQRAVRCQVYRADELPDGIMAEWGAEFDSRDVARSPIFNEHRSLRGWLRLHIQDGRIVRLTEVYAQEITKLDPKIEHEDVLRSAAR
jgi:hypothetical protein